MSRAIDRVAATVAALTLLAACSNHSGVRMLPAPSDGSAPPSSGAPLPSGLAGAPSSSGHRPTPSRPAPTSSVRSGSPAAAHSAVHRSSSGGSSRARTTSAAPHSSPAPPPSGPRVSVSPSSGLSDGARVQVTVAGFSPRTLVRIRECVVAGGVCGPDLRWVTTDPSGQVSRSVAVASSEWGHNCGAHGCVVSVKQPDGTAASAPIGFR